MRRFFILVIVISVFSNCYAGSTAVVDKVCYYFNPDKRTAIVCSNTAINYEGDIVIPATVTYNGVSYLVTGIAEKAFQNCRDLTTVEIKAKITTIGKQAFDGCWELKCLYIPNSVSEIGNGAFNQCRSMKRIRLSCNITSIKDRTFLGCRSLEYLEIPEGVTSIEEYAFADCSMLKRLVLPSTVTDYKYGICDYCPELNYINIRSKIPPNITQYTFRMNGTEITYPILLVPYGSKDLYKGVGGSYFNSVVEGNLKEGTCRNINNLLETDISWDGNGKQVTENSYTTYYLWTAKVRVKNNSDKQIQIIRVTKYIVDYDGVQGLTNKSKINILNGMLSGGETLDDSFTEKWYTKKEPSVPCLKIDYLLDGIMYTKYSGPIYEEVIPCMEGDVNSDGVIDTHDIKEIENYILGNNYNNFIFDNADINKDGKVNVADIVEILSIMR